jgi:CMP-N,N'-diacetyllegionaminic acid synthase
MGEAQGNDVMSYTAFVPARSGSKRLPNKNIKLLGGKPLFVWTLEACVNSEKVDRVLFSTDSAEYWELAKQHISSDKLMLDDRSSEEAGDKVKIFDYLQGKAETLFSDQNGHFILCLPTMPFRTASDIDKAIAMLENTGKPVFSAIEYDFAVSFAFKMDGENSWEPVFEESPLVTGNTRSQDQFDAFHPNGAIYVRAIKDLLEPSLNTFYENAVPFIMDREKSVDIDTEKDFMKAEVMIKYIDLE